MDREVRIVGASTFEERIAAVLAIEQHGERTEHIVHSVKYKDKHYTVEVHVFKTIVAEIVKKREFKLQGMQAKDMELG